MKQKLRHYMPLILVTIALCAAPVASVSWNSIDLDVATYSATEWAYQRNTVKLDNGTVVAFYTDTTKTNVFMSTSEDNGATWRDPPATIDIASKDVDQICVEIWPDIYEELDVIIVVWREEKIADPPLYQLMYGIIDPYEWEVDWGAMGYISTGTSNQTDPYIVGTDFPNVTCVWAEAATPGGVDYVIMQATCDLTGLFQTGIEDIQWGEAEGALSQAPGGLTLQRWPCLAMDRNRTGHMTFSGYNDTAWQLWYCNKTISEGYFDDYVLVHDNSKATDQVKASTIVANITDGEDNRDAILTVWDEGKYPRSIGVQEINCSGLWEGADDPFTTPVTFDDDGAGPNLGFHGNRMLCIWQNWTTSDIKWAYDDVTSLTITLDVTIAEVPGQDGWLTYRYDPGFIWSYYGGHDMYLAVGTMDPIIDSLNDVNQVWCLNLYTAPDGGGGGGGGGGGDGGAAPAEVDDDGGTCCGSSAAIGAIAVSSICMIGWTRRTVPPSHSEPSREVK